MESEAERKAMVDAWRERCIAGGPPAPDRIWVCPMIDWDDERLNWDDGCASIQTDGSVCDTEYIRADLVAAIRDTGAPEK